jgi:hypothetical protein
MAYHGATAIPQVWADDGAAFVFTIVDAKGVPWNCGFMRRPIHQVEFVGGTVTPPVTWTEYDSLDSWVETIKYAARNNVPVSVNFDDAISVNYQSWSATYPSGGDGAGFGFQPVYGIAEMDG